jgi:hypothetical protein
MAEKGEMGNGISKKMLEYVAIKQINMWKRVLGFSKMSSSKNAGCQHRVNFFFFIIGPMDTYYQASLPGLSNDRPFITYLKKV